MGERALVLSGDAWEMKDERTGELLSGVSVWYVSNYREDDEKSAGFKPTKIAASMETFKAIRLDGLPGVFELDFASRPGAQNKAALTLVGAKHVGKVDLFGSKVSKAA